MLLILSPFPSPSQMLLSWDKSPLEKSFLSPMVLVLPYASRSNKLVCTFDITQSHIIHNVMARILRKLVS